MSAVDELDEVPDAASPETMKLRRDVRQAFREKHGRDPAEEDLHKCVLIAFRLKFQGKLEGRDREPTLKEYKVACENGGIPAAVLQSHLESCEEAERKKLPAAAFFQEHGRELTEEEAEKFLAAVVRDDPMDHVGPVGAEEADTYRRYARLSFMVQEARDPTDDEVSEFADKIARGFRRAVLEAVNPDVAAVRRILVSRNVAAAKRDDAPPAVAFGPPPRPEDAEETFFERAARLEHDKVLVVAAAAYQTLCALDDAASKKHYDEVYDIARSDEAWDQQTEVARGVISGLGDEAPCRVVAAGAVDAVIKTGNQFDDVSLTDPYATSYATLLERLARESLDPGSEFFLPAGKYDLPSLSSDDAADIAPSVENASWDDHEGCIAFARRLARLRVLFRIDDTVVDKKERDAAVEREAARVRLKQQEASSRAAEADLLALLAAEDAAAPRSKKKKKKKKKKRGESPAPTPAAAPETKAAAPETPAAPADAAAEEKAPETDASEAAPEDATEEAPSETAPPPEAPVSEPDVDAPQSATGERRRSLADLAAAEAAPAPAAPPEEDAWETVARRPRQTAAATPPRRRRSDHADAPKHSIDDLLALEATAGALPDDALPKLGAFGGRCYVTQKGDIYQPITEPRRRHSSEGSEARRAGGRVFVHNVRGLTEQVIWRIFDDPRVGRVVRVQMQTDDAGAPRNYCFVDYEDATSATLAIQCLDAHVVGGRSLRVEATRADAPPASTPDAAAGPASLLPLLAPKDEAPPTPPPPAPGLDPDVARFLDNLGLAGVGPILAREEIDWETLGLLDAGGLSDAGIPRDDAQFIIVAYGSLGGVPPTPTPTAAPRPAPPAAPAPAAATAPGTPERDECPICFEPEKSTALVPCGHILCGACAAKYAHCPVCREPVASRMRVFW